MSDWKPEDLEHLVKYYLAEIKRKSPRPPRVKVVARNFSNGTGIEYDRVYDMLFNHIVWRYPYGCKENPIVVE
jgi:hypothetical protein